MKRAFGSGGPTGDYRVTGRSTDDSIKRPVNDEALKTDAKYNMAGYNYTLR